MILVLIFLLRNIDCGYMLEPPRRGGSNEYPQSMFRSKIRKIIIPMQTPVLLYKSGVLCYVPGGPQTIKTTGEKPY